MRLNISMHNTLAVAEVQSLEELKDVEPDIDVIELRVEASEIGIVDVLENEGRRLTLRIPNNVEQGNNIRTSGQILEDLNLALDLLLLHRL
jgi:nitrous oxidase accessory protein NosD